MFRRQKQKKRAHALVLCTTIILSLAACQKNPDSSIVMNKDLDKMIEQAGTPGGDENAQASALGKKYDAYKTTIEDEKLKVKVNVDAKVDIPETDKMSVFRVSQQKISQELLDTVRKELIGDTVLYDGAVLREPTKADVEEEIASWRAEMKEVFDNNADINSKDSAEYQDARNHLAELEQKYENAPAGISFENRESDGKLQNLAKKCSEGTPGELYSWLHDLVPEGEAYYGVTDGKDDNYTGLYAMNSDTRGDFLSYRKGRHGYDWLQMDGFAKEPLEAYSNPNTVTITDEPCKLTLNDAIKIADDFLAKTGLNHDEIKFSYFDGGLMSEPIGNIGGDIDKSVIPVRSHYVLTYTRCIHGAFVTAGGAEKFADGTKDGVYQKKTWPTEEMQFRINDSGIVGFDYRAPLSITETVVDNSAMKSFTNIKSIFEKMIVMTNAQEGMESNLNIERVILGYALISEPDSFDTGLLVPTWDFCGTKDSGGSLKQEGTLIKGKYQPYLTINAIDGSVIDRTLGY